MATKTKRTTKRNKRKIRQIPSSGKAYISAGFNNTLITITDTDGNTLFSGSAGKAGFRGSRKSTPYAATKSAEYVAQKAYEAGVKEVAVIVRGPGLGRISSIRALRNVGLRVTSIADASRMPHNGCRAKKKRRV